MLVQAEQQAARLLQVVKVMQAVQVMVTMLLM
jgi:hypothetical protein